MPWGTRCLPHMSSAKPNPSTQLLWTHIEYTFSDVRKLPCDVSWTLLARPELCLSCLLALAEHRQEAAAPYITDTKKATENTDPDGPGRRQGESINNSLTNI